MATDVQVMTCLARIEEKLNHVVERQDINTRLLTGNGHPDDGLITKVDRLAQDSAKRKKMSEAATVSAISSFVAAVVAAFAALWR